MTIKRTPYKVLKPPVLQISAIVGFFIFALRSPRPIALLDTERAKTFPPIFKLVSKHVESPSKQAVLFAPHFISKSYGSQKQAAPLSKSLSPRLALVPVLKTQMAPQFGSDKPPLLALRELSFDLSALISLFAVLLLLDVPCSNSRMHLFGDCSSSPPFFSYFQFGEACDYNLHHLLCRADNVHSCSAKNIDRLHCYYRF
jgi:hypothetical protein